MLHMIGQHSSIGLCPKIYLKFHFIHVPWWLFAKCNHLLKGKMSSLDECPSLRPSWFVLSWVYHFLAASSLHPVLSSAEPILNKTLKWVSNLSNPCKLPVLLLKKIKPCSSMCTNHILLGPELSTGAQLSRGHLHPLQQPSIVNSTLVMGESSWAPLHSRVRMLAHSIFHRSYAGSHTCCELVEPNSSIVRLSLETVEN